MAHVMVTGARGMLGDAVCRAAPSGTHLVPVDIDDGDLSQPGVAADLVSRHRPDIIIHCAAWTDVDGCTRDPHRAMVHNAGATELLAQACTADGKRLVYISTDYVFSGTLGRPYHEYDRVGPLNPYGESKLLGEQSVARLPDYCIVRTQWLYGPAGKNFVATILKAAQSRAELRVVADEYGSPTLTTDLASALWIVATSDVTGVVHLTGQGICSWFQLARLAVREAGLTTRVCPISSADWGSVTSRPHYAPLANDRWTDLGLPPLRPWQEAVAWYVHSAIGDGSIAASAQKP